MQELLKEKFGDCKFQGVTECEGSFVVINEESFFIFDPPPALNEPVKKVADDQNFQLSVINNQKADVCLVKVDKCLIRDNDPKCDCILFDAKKLYFVEIKNSSPGTRKDKRNKAIKQLEATIGRLKDNAIDLKHYDAQAIICFQTNDRRPIQATISDKQVAFLEKNKMPLFEANEISF